MGNMNEQRREKNINRQVEYTSKPKWEGKIHKDVNEQRKEKKKKNFKHTG